MAQASPNSPASTPGNDSGTSSPRPTHPSGLVGGLKSALRQHQKVNFTLGHEPEANATTPSDLEAGLSQRPIPTLRIPESEDVGDASLSDPDWKERTSAAAEKAKTAADQLFTDLSRRNSVNSLGAPTTKESVDPAYESSAATSPPSRWTRLFHRSAQKTRATQQPKLHSSPPLRPLDTHPIKFDDIPLMSHEKPSRPYDINEDTDDDNDPTELKPLRRQPNAEHLHEAKRLVRTLTRGRQQNAHEQSTHDPESGARTPAIDKHLHDLDYVPAPDQYKPGILGAILTSRLQDLQRRGEQTRDFYKPQQLDGWLTPGGYTPKDAKRRPEHERSQSYDATSNGSSGTATPKRKWYDKSPTTQGSGIGAILAQASLSSTAPGVPGTPGAARPSIPRSKSVDLISSAVDIIKKGSYPRSRAGFDSEAETIVQVADIIARREYLKKLCRAFMRYGAPTHRMEEYLSVSARALYVHASFLYMPGVMIITYPDDETYSSHMQVIRESSALDFGRMKDAFDVYKCVIHDKYTAEEAGELLDDIAKRPDRYTTLFRIFFYGIAAICVGPFAFGARPWDFVPIFFMGAALGFFQLVIMPRSDQFSHVFEVFTAFVTAFIARGLGSISIGGENRFCFSAMAQSSIALILPGYIVLNAALELQSRNIVSGSVRMVYAIIYTLFLGFGLLIGTVVYGLIDSNATADVVCNVPEWWSPGLNFGKLLYTRFIWVPLFAICLAIINQAKWRQFPVMALIAVLGHQANFWISQRLASNVQVANAIGAFVIGVAANLYSRWFHGVAAAAMLPGIFVQVPSGLAASGTLVAGIKSSEQIQGNSTAISVINNGTAGFIAAQEDPNSVYSGTIYNVGYGMVQVAIGISVGLYLSALVVYPFGKRRSGLFSF